MSKSKSGLVKSTVPVEHGVTNPAYSRVQYLLGKTPEVRNIGLQIQAWAKEGKSFAEIKVLMAETLRPKLKNIYDDFKSQPDTPPVIGAPPRPAEIYGRFGNGVRVLDIGSGNGSKIIGFSGSIKLTCVDPQLQIEESAARCVRKRFEDIYHSLDKAELRLTSFMALCQLSPDWQRVVLQHDGLHMVPDHKLLLRIGAAYESDEKINVFAPRTVFSDFPMDELAGFSIEPGYQILAGFEPRDINIHLKTKTFQSTVIPTIQASPIAYTDIDLSDVSYKMDGEPFEIKNLRSVSTLVNRAGVGREASSNIDFFFKIHVERLKNCYTLIRILVYNGFVPPHCYSVMEQFLKRVRITIGGLPVCMPPKWGQHGMVVYQDSSGIIKEFREGIDGLITRHLQKDYYCKFQWTIDVRPDIETHLREKLAERGWFLEAEFQPDLFEYGMNRHEHMVTLKPIRIRTDKIVGTTLDTILFLLEQKTIPEILTLSNI